MESNSAAITLLIFSALLVIAFSYWLWRKGRIGRFAVIGLLAYIFISTYLAFYPSDSFYKSEFERVTDIKFPSSGVFIEKRSSYPDIHGDYSSCALFTVSPEDFEYIKSKIVATFEAETGSEPNPCTSHDKWQNKPPSYLYSLKNESEGENREWGLLKGNRIYFSFGSQ
jgi:hypothetical protein